MANKFFHSTFGVLLIIGAVVFVMLGLPSYFAYRDWMKPKPRVVNQSSNQDGSFFADVLNEGGEGDIDIKFTISESSGNNGGLIGGGPSQSKAIRKHLKRGESAHVEFKADFVQFKLYAWNITASSVISPSP